MLGVTGALHPSLRSHPRKPTDERHSASPPRSGQRRRHRPRTSREREGPSREHDDRRHGAQRPRPDRRHRLADDHGAAHGRELLDGPPTHLHRRGANRRRPLRRVRRHLPRRVDHRSAQGQHRRLHRRPRTDTSWPLHRHDRRHPTRRRFRVQHRHSHGVGQHQPRSGHLRRRRGCRMGLRPDRRVERGTRQGSRAVPGGPTVPAARVDRLDSGVRIGAARTAPRPAFTRRHPLRVRCRPRRGPAHDRVVQRR